MAQMVNLSTVPLEEVVSDVVRVESQDCNAREDVLADCEC